MLNSNDYILYSGTGNHSLHKDTLERINELTYSKLKFHHMNMGVWEDEESDDKLEKNEDIKGNHVIFFYSVDSNKLFTQVLTNVWAAKFQYGAETITLVMPFMRYRRQDHDGTEYKDEIQRNKMFLHYLKAGGVDRLILCDIHSQTTIDEATKLGIKTFNTDPTPAFARFLKARIKPGEADDHIVRAPDYGSIARSAALAKELGLKLSIANKLRMKKGEIMHLDDDSEFLEKIRGLYPDVKIISSDSCKDLNVIMRDDEITTGATANSDACDLKKKYGAKSVELCITHPVCASAWKRKLLNDEPFDRILFGNTLFRNYEDSTGGKIVTIGLSLDIAEETIKALES